MAAVGACPVGSAAVEHWPDRIAFPVGSTATLKTYVNEGSHLHWGLEKSKRSREITNSLWMGKPFCPVKWLRLG